MKKWQNGEEVYSVYAQSIIKNLFSIINIFLITYLLIDRKTSRVSKEKLVFLCFVHWKYFSGAGNGEWGIHTYRL